MIIKHLLALLLLFVGVNMSQSSAASFALDGEITVYKISPEAAKQVLGRYKLRGIVESTNYLIDVIALQDPSEIDHSIGRENGVLYTIMKSPPSVGLSQPKTKALGYIDSTVVPRMGRTSAKIACLMLADQSDFDELARGGQVLHMRDNHYFKESDCTYRYVKSVADGAPDILEAKSPNQMWSPAEAGKLIPMPKPFDGSGFEYWKLLRFRHDRGGKGYSMNITLSQRDIKTVPNQDASSYTSMEAEGSIMCVPSETGSVEHEFRPRITDPALMVLDFRRVKELGKELSRDSIEGAIPLVLTNRAWNVDQTMYEKRTVDIKYQATQRQRSSTIKRIAIGALIAMTLGIPIWTLLSRSVFRKQSK